MDLNRLGAASARYECSAAWESLAGIDDCQVIEAIVEQRVFKAGSSRWVALVRLSTGV